MSPAPPDDPESNTTGDDFASMLAEFERESPTPKKRARGPRVGETVEGRIVSIGFDAIFVDLGAKAEGRLDAAPFRDERGDFSVKIGDRIQATVVATDDVQGAIVLRQSLGRGPEARAELQLALESGIPVEGKVTAVNKGGLEVAVAGARAFCPMSQVDLRPVEDPAALVGHVLQFRLTKYEPGPKGRENLVLSRRALLEEEAARRAVETRKTLAVGAVIVGKVSSVREFGAFVDLGGIEGLLHKSELGFSRSQKPSDLLSSGQPVTVQIVRIEKSEEPGKPERISLSLKSLEKDPWQDAHERFPEGARLAGTVMRVETFGAFVELAPGVEGLLHVSELAGGRKVTHARQAAKVGERVEVVVQSVDVERRRISLGSSAGRDESDGDYVPPPSAPSGGAKGMGTFGDLLHKAAAKKKR